MSKPHRDQIAREKAIELHHRQRLSVLDGKHYMVTGTFKDEETKWRFGVSLCIGPRGAARRKEKLEEMYPGEEFTIEIVTEDNIDLPSNHM